MSFTPTNALPQIPAIQRAVDPDTGKITAEWLRWLNLVKQRTDYLSVEGIIDARTIIEGTITVDTLPALSAMTGQITYPQMPLGAGTWVGSPTISGDVTISANLLPSLTDTSDLGSSTKQFRRGYISEINAVLFSKQTQQLYGGWLAVSKNAGTFGSAVLSGDAIIDFGQAMTLNQFVLVRALDSAGAITEEYIKVGALYAGTSYSVTRNLSGAGAKNWPAGTPYQVRGVAGDGWLELNAFDTPRMSIFSQGSAYNNSTELIRIGHLAGMPNGSSGIGIYAGDATNYFRWDGSTFKVVASGCTIDTAGITLGTPAAFSNGSALKFQRAGGNGYGQAGDVLGLASVAVSSDTRLTLENTIKGIGATFSGNSGKSRVSLIATGWDSTPPATGSATTPATVEARSEIGVSRITLDAGDDVTLTGGRLKFPAAQNASSDANTLDDYEEGTFTPVDASGAGLVFAFAQGKYTKIGQRCFVDVTVQYPVTANGLAAVVGGLPFTAGIEGALAPRFANSPGAQVYTCNVVGATTGFNMWQFSGVGMSNAALSNSFVACGGSYIVV
jgi:hypothetical protein